MEYTWKNAWTSNVHSRWETWWNKRAPHLWQLSCLWAAHSIISMRKHAIKQGYEFWHCVMLTCMHCSLLHSCLHARKKHLALTHLLIQRLSCEAPLQEPSFLAGSLPWKHIWLFSAYLYIFFCTLLIRMAELLPLQCSSDAGKVHSMKRHFSPHCWIASERHGIQCRGSIRLLPLVDTLVAGKRYHGYCWCLLTQPPLTPLFQFSFQTSLVAGTNEAEYHS